MVWFTNVCNLVFRADGFYKNGTYMGSFNVKRGCSPYDIKRSPVDDNWYISCGNSNEVLSHVGFIY